MKLSILAAALSVAALASAAEAATVIDFNEFAADSTKIHGPKLVSQGFSVTAPSGAGLASWGRTLPNNGDPGGAALMNWNGGTVTIARLDGGLFSLDSLDFGDVYNVGSPETISFSFFDGVRTTVREVVLDRAKGMETVSLGLGSLQSFSFHLVHGTASIQFDNLTVGEPVTSAVPEPATWAMMILGFGAVGTAVRTRRRSRVIFA
ncbi:MAG TPA: PEPxxWA-CTERM sorting domain-containing protein [Phenylobacterium sp.]|nr:PEPxxWA-CTERM sorting domain-containing protein [Phenylobacterium sp.]